MPRRRESAISQGKRGSDVENEEVTVQKKQRTAEDSNSPNQSSVESPIVIEDVEEHSIVTEENHGQTPTKEGNTVVVLEGEGQPVYETAKGQGHTIYEQPRRETSASGRNLSLEALFQVTDTELQAMTKQTPHLIIPPDIQSETVVESSQSEPSGEASSNLIGEPDVYRQEGVKIQGHEDGGEKYELRSHALEQQGLKFIYTKQADAIGREAVTIASLVPYQTESIANGKVVQIAEGNITQVQTTNDSIIYQPVGSKRKREPVHTVEQPAEMDQEKVAQNVEKLANKAGGTVEGHIRVKKQSSKPGKHICPYCHRGCAKPSVLEKHIRAHTGERPYPCETCGFSFKTKSNLYKHCKSRAHTLKVGIETKKRKITFGSLDDVNVNEVEISTEAEDVDISDSETESGEEREDEEKLGIARQEQAPTHVLKQVAEFLGKTKDERPKIETEKFMKEAKQKKAVQKKVVQRASTVKGNISSSVTPDKKQVVRSFSVPSHFAQLHDHQGLSRFVPVSSNNTHQEKQKYTSSDIITAPIVQETQPGQLILPTQFLPTSLNFKIQIPRLNPTNTSSKEIKTTKTVESISSSKDIKSIESLESSYNQIEMVTLPHPEADEETTNKALRDLEALSEKFKNALKDGVRLQKSIEKLPDKRVRVIIKVQEPADKSPDAAPQLSGIVRSNSVSQPEKQTPSIKGLTAAELKERISQLISANEAIVESPKLEPLRPKFVKRTLSRQDSEIKESSKAAAFQKSSAGMKLKRQDASESEKENTDAVKNYGENVIVERIESDGESIIILSNKDDIDDDQIEIEEQPVQLVSDETINLEIQKKIRDTDKIKETHSEKIQMSSMKQNPLSRYFEIIKPPADNQNKSEPSQAQNMSTSNSLTKKGIVYQPSVEKVFGSQSENVILTAVSAPVLPVAQQVVLQTQQQPPTPTILTLPPSKLILSSQSDTLIKYPVFNKSVTVTSPLSASTESLPARVPGQVGKMALKNMKLRSKSLSSSVPSSKSMPKPEVSVPSSLHIANIPQTPTTGIQTPTTPLTPHNQSLSILGQMQQGNIQHFLVRTDSVPLLMANPQLLQKEQSVIQSTAAVPTTSTGTVMQNIFSPGVSSITGTPILTNTTKPATRPTSLSTSSNKPLISFDPLLLKSKFTSTQMNLNSPAATPVATIDPETNEIKIQINLHPVSNVFTPVTDTQGSNTKSASKAEHRGHTPSWAEPSPAVTSPFSTSASVATVQSKLSPPTYRFQSSPVSRVITPTRPRNTPVFRFGSQTLSSPTVIQSPQHMPVFRFQTAQKTKSGTETVTQITDPQILHKLLTSGKLKISSDETASTTLNTERSDASPAVDQELRTAESFEKAAETQQQSKLIYGPHKCNFCGIAFRKEGTLNLHLLYYCKVRHKRSSRPHRSPSVDREIIAELFAQPSARLRLKQEEKDSTLTETITSQSDANLVFENFEPSVWPKRKSKVKIVTTSEEEIKPGRAVPVITTPSTYRRWFPPLRRSKSEVVENKSSSEVGTQKTRPAWEQKLKGQILRRKLKGKLLMKRSLSFDASTFKETPESKPKVSKTVVETKSDTPEKSKDVPISKKFGASVANETTTYRLRRPPLRRSESVPAIKRSSTKTGESDVKEEQNTSQEVVPVSPTESPEKSVVNWHLSDISVPVMYAPCLNLSGTIPKPIYQQNSRMRFFDGMGTPQSLVPSAILTPRPDLTVDKIKKKFTFENSSERHQPDNNTSQEIPDAEKVSKTSDIQTPRTPLSAKSPNSLLSLTLLGHSYPTLRNLTHITFCCLNRLQPMYVCGGRNKKVSMYSNWCIAKHNPNPYGLSAKTLLSLYNSRYTSNPVWAINSGSNSNSGVITHSSYWQFKEDQKSCSDSVKKEEGKLDSYEDVKPDKNSLPSKVEVKITETKGKVIKIFQGGYKSLEPYTYVRGRGRGKYVCEECGIRCKKPSMLKKHIRTHTDLRPYSCNHCKFSFKTKGNLTKHMKSKAHQKKCIEIGIVPVPLYIDDSQIDYTALEAQCSLSKHTQISPGGSHHPQESFEDDDDDDNDDNGADEEDDTEENETEVMEVDDKSSEPEVEIIKDEVSSSKSEPSSSLDDKRKYFLEALGVIAKQPDPREMVRQTSQEGVASQLNIGSSLQSVAVSSVAVSATVASDLSTVYDLEKLHSSQNEDNEGRIRKDQEIIWSLLNLSDERKQSPKEKEKQSTAVEGTVEQTQEDKVQENDKTNETPASEVASSQLQSTASQNNIPVKIPLGGFGPPLIHVIKDSKLASSDTQEQHLARGPIVGQMIRQDSNPGSNSDNVEKASSESVFIPFQFQHPFPTSEDLATSPVKLVVSPDKKGSLSEIISLVISSKAEGNVDSSQTVSSKVSNVLIPVSVQKGIQPKTVHLSADGCKMSEVQAEIINVDPETFEINAKACKKVSEEENSKTPSKSIDNDEVFIIDSKEGKDNQTLVVKNMGEVEDSSIQSGSASSNVLTMSAVGNWHQAENLSILSEGLSKDSSGKTTKPRSIVIRQSTGGPNIIIQFDENVSSKVQDTRPAQSYKAEQSKGRFVCNICQSSFPEQQQLTLHMNIHVLKSKLKCRKCNMTFRSTHSYEKHIAYDIHIGDENTDELVATVDNPRPFKCEPCDIAFRLKGHLTKHFRSKTHFSQLESQGILNPGTYEKVEAKLVDLEATSLDNFLNEMKSMCHSVDGSADRLSKSVDNTQLGPKIKPRTDYIVIEAPNKAQQSETNQEVVDSSSGTNFLEGLKKYSKSQFEIDKEASNRNVTVEIKQSMIEMGSAEGESDVGNNGMGNSEKETDLVGNLVCEESKSSAVCTYDTKTEDVKEEKEFIAVPYKPTSSGDFDGMGVSVSDGPHICGLCRQGFKTMLLLKTHLITHAELRPYVCEYCDAGFTNGQSLRIHLLTHTQERPYICGLCGDTFANTDHLLDHTKSQHTSSSNVPYTSSSSGEVHTVVSSSHIFSLSELNSSTSICGTVLSVQPLSGSGSSVGNQISGPDLPSNTGVVKMEPSHHKVRIRHLKRQERVGSPDQQEITALRVEKINNHEQAESLSTSGERVTSPVGERVASPDQENIVHTTDDTVTKTVLDDHIIKTEIAESNTFENVSSLVISKQEDISHTVDITPDESVQGCSPLAQDVSENNRVSEETCSSLSVQSIDEFVQSPLGVVNISEISCSDNTGNPVIVVVGNPIQESSSNADNEKLFSEAQLSEKTLEIDTSLIDDSNNESRTDSDKIAQLIPVEIPVEHTSSVKDEVDQRVNLNIVDNGNMLEILPLEVSAEHEKLQITQTDQIKEESLVHSVCSLADSAENRDISNADIIESGQHTEENQDPRVNVSEITSLEQVIVSDSSVMFTATCLSSDIKNVSDINNAEVYEQNSQTALEQEDVDMATDEVSEQTMKDDESASGN